MGSDWLDEDNIKTKVWSSKRFFDHRGTAVTSALMDPVEVGIFGVHFAQKIADVRGRRSGKVGRILNGFCGLHGVLNNDIKHSIQALPVS